MAAPLWLVSPLKVNQGIELSMTPICALHNQSQGRFIAMQHFVAAIGFPGREPIRTGS